MAQSPPMIVVVCMYAHMYGFPMVVASFDEASQLEPLFVVAALLVAALVVATLVACGNVSYHSQLYRSYRGATLVFLFQFTLVAKRAMALSGPMLLQSHHIQLPQTAKFFPKEASLTLHWMLDPTKTPEYLENAANSKKEEEVRKEEV